ncbi:MAG: hypothetical protein E7404_02670 [Ruminococcaceae bacterium]|nr:hypothetical protein [Oscillospiraceae bacterium]
MCQNVSRCVLNVVIALIIGAVTGVLFGFGFLTGVVALWGTFVLGIFGLAIATGIAILSNCTGCCVRRCSDEIICIVIGSIGAVAASLLSISIAGIGTVLSAVIAGLVGFFAALVLLSLISIASDANQCR